MKLPYEEIIKMNALLMTLPNFGDMTLEYLFRAVNEIEVLKEEDMKKKVLEWAEPKGLLNPQIAPQQFMKLVEEVGELSNAILKGDKAEQIDALGDIQVVLIILAEQLGFDLDTCLECAYNEIKNRKGKTINGSFIKD